MAAVASFYAYVLSQVHIEFFLYSLLSLHKS